NDVVMSDADLEKVVSRLSGMNGLAREQAGLPPKNWRAGLESRMKDADRVRLARGRLAAEGIDKNLAAKFSPTQVILLDEKREYDCRRDERMRNLSLPFWQVEALESNKGSGNNLFADLLPDIATLRQNQVRLEQRIALLLHVEALRIYAAEHAGHLPDKLAEISAPLPVDPISGKPFAYVLKDSIAQLRGSAPRGEEKNPEFNLQYEVTIKK